MSWCMGVWRWREAREIVGSGGCIELERLAAVASASSLGFATSLALDTLAMLSSAALVINCMPLPPLLLSSLAGKLGRRVKLAFYSCGGR